MTYLLVKVREHFQLPKKGQLCFAYSLSPLKDVKQFSISRRCLKDTHSTHEWINEWKKLKKIPQINLGLGKYWNDLLCATVMSANVHLALARFLSATLTPCIMVLCDSHRNLCNNELYALWRNKWGLDERSMVVQKQVKSGSCNFLKQYTT